MLTNSYLQITSSTGTEVWNVTKSTFSLRQVAGNSDYFINFNVGSIRSECDKANDESVMLPESISFGLRLRIKEEDAKDLVGLVREIEIVGSEDSDDNFGNLYYFEHQTPWKVRFEIKDRQEEKYRILISCQVNDVNYYDGSKPANTIEIDYWAPLINI